MHFEKNTIYHIYNQGNNKQAIFFKPENYLFFLRKMREHLLPYGDLLCYCLMPNHFHWLFFVNETELVIENISVGVTSSHSDTPASPKKRTLNDSIAILLRSYTRAINIQENRTGALFREKTKAQNGIIDGLITINGKNSDLFFSDGMGYERICFNYIHQNPVKAGLVSKSEDWIYSSPQDYKKLRNGTICNQEKAKTLGIMV